MFNKPLLNNRIRAKEVRVIDRTGQNLGVMALAEALKLAYEKGLDLVQVTEKVEPPVCKIIEYGKYLYALQKKARQAGKAHGDVVKGIRLTFGISSHDMSIRVKSAEKFLKQGHPIKVEMLLRGREKALPNFARQKMKQFIEELGKLLPIKLERDIKREGRGLTMLIAKE